MAEQRGRAARHLQRFLLDLDFSTVAYLCGYSRKPG